MNFKKNVNLKKVKSMEKVQIFLKRVREIQKHELKYSSGI